MTLKLPHWFASASIAIALHIGLFIFVFSNHTQGALAEGKHGIEIDLGMLGDFGEQAQTQLSKVEPSPQKAQPDEIIQEKKVVETKVIETPVEPEKKEIVAEEVIEDRQPIQDVDVAVFEEEPRHVDDTILVDDQIAEINNISETKPPILEHNVVKNHVDQTTQSQTKLTTGDASSLNNGGQSGIDQSYLAKLLAKLAQHKRYPLSSRKKAHEGVAVLDFEISRTGRVITSTIQKSSGFNALDKAVLVMLKRAEPFPPVPPDIKGEPIRFTLPISFKLNG